MPDIEIEKESEVNHPETLYAPRIDPILRIWCVVGPCGRSYSRFHDRDVLHGSQNGDRTSQGIKCRPDLVISPSIGVTRTQVSHTPSSLTSTGSRISAEIGHSSSLDNVVGGRR